MPRAAIDLGAVDLVLDLSEIGSMLTDIIGAFTVWIPRTARHLDAPDKPTPGPRASRLPVATVLAETGQFWDSTPADGAAQSSPQATSPAGPSLTTSRSRVLVVDDNRDMRDYLMRLLTGDWDVDAVGDGQQPLDSARHRRPDLVIADGMMPNLDGLALVRQLRAEGALRGIPVIMLSARADERAAIEGLAAGANDYLAKPFAAPELVARVGAQLELARVREDADRRFHALVESSFDVVYRMSPDWSEMHELDGRGFIADTSEPSQSWLNRYIHPDDQPRVLAAIDRAVQTRTVFELKHRVLGPDKTLGWTLSRSIPLLDNDGEVLEWVGIAGDLTSRPSAEGEPG